MPADQPFLPGNYNAGQIIGVTRGSSRPTLYFDDGSRFTQRHGHQDNIGFHKPPAYGHLFFGNLPEQKARGIRYGGEEDVTKFIMGNKSGPWPPYKAPKMPKDGLRLLEVKRTIQGKGYKRHLSRQALQPISKDEQLVLFFYAIHRTTEKEEVGGQWQFKDGTPP